MIEFVSFLIREKLGPLEVLENAQTRLEKMRCNLQARGGFHRAKFQDADSKIIITEDDLKNFYASSKCTTAKQALGREDELTVREIINVRNFLISSVIIENSCRPAALYALSKTAIKKALKSPQRTETGVLFYSVPSFYDKTVAVSGLPTYLVLSKPLMGHMSKYISKFCPKIANRNPNSPDDMFLLENGQRMDSEAVSNSFRN